LAWDLKLIMTASMERRREQNKGHTHAAFFSSDPTAYASSFSNNQIHYNSHNISKLHYKRFCDRHLIPVTKTLFYISSKRYWGSYNYLVTKIR